VSRSREEVRGRVAYHAYRTVAWLGRTLPEHTGRLLFKWLGLLAHAVAPRLRATVAANQAQILGRPVDDPLVRASTREAFVLYARYWFDSFHAVRIPFDELLERFECVGIEHMQDALAAGTGVIMALPHIGNWDVASRWLDAQGIDPVAVAEQLEPPELFDLFVRHREALGMEVIGLSADGVGQKIRRAIETNHLIALVSDRDLTGRGVEVEMFGRPRKLPAGPALLSLATGAPLVVAPIYQTDDAWKCVMYPPCTIEPTGNRREDVVALTQQMAVCFERAISAAPADWHVFQPAWEP
jgi:KDO2-lipid IV(A) lauroyltransferase